MLNNLRWETIRLARNTGKMHYLISNGQDLRIVNSENTLIEPGLWWIEFAGFKYSNTDKLKDWGVLSPL
jgi:hypothetical protein